jgi:esterase
LILNYKQYGTDGPSVVIVHGLFGMLDNWHNIAKKLSEHFSVISIDVRNHGGSPHHESMTYDDICHDIKSTLESLNINLAHFIGHSMGGKAVMKLADLYPELINKLCVVDIAPKKYKPGHELIFKSMFALPVQSLSSRTEAENLLAETITDQGIRLFILKNLDRLKGGGYQWKLGLQNIYNNYETIIDGVKLSWPFSNPALFVTGDRSKYVLADDQLDILSMFPNTSFTEISNAGHWVHAENPNDFYNTIFNFLR